MSGRPAPPPQVSAATPTGSPGQPNGRGWAYAGLIFGSTSSVAANVGHAFVRPTHAPTDWQVQPGAIAWGVAVAVALLISVEVLARAAWPSTPGWRTVRYAGGTTVALVAAGTSYRHLSDLLAHWGETTPVVYGGPAIVDGLMILSSFALMIPEPASIAPAPIGAPAPAPDPVTEPSTPDPRPDPTPQPDSIVVDPPLPVPARPADPDPIPVAAATAAPHRIAARADTRSGRGGSTRPVMARPEDVAAVEAALASGELPPSPSAEAIRAHLKISPAYARATRDALTTTGNSTANQKPSPYKNTDEEVTEAPEQEPIPAVTR